MSEKMSVSEGEMDLWHRIIAKRRAEWSSLPPDEIASIITPLLLNIETPAMEINDPWQRTEFILKTHFTVSVDRRVEPKKRRTAWHVVSNLLHKLDAARGRGASQQRQTAAPNKELHATISSGDLISQKSAGLNRLSSTEKDKPRSPQSSAPTESSSSTYKASVATVQEQPKRKSSEQRILQQKKPSVTENEPVSLSGFLAQPQKQNQQQQQSVQQQQPSTARSQPVNVSDTHPQQQRQQHLQERQQLPAVQSEPIPISSTKPASVDVVPARATPTPPTSVVSQRPQPSKGKSVGSEASAFRSTAKVAPATIPKKPPPPPPLLPPISISFGPDTQKYAAAVDKNGRSNLQVTIQPRKISSDEYARTLKRFERWDRYWKMERVVCLVETFPLCRLDNLRVGTSPQQATECTIKLDPRDVSRVRDWGRPVSKDKRYSHGEMRLLVRMLPVTLAGQKKRPRADTHLWPKGTFVQLNGMPVFIDQRRQQQHDLNEWKSMSASLDLSCLVRTPTNSNKLQLYCLDKEPYILCVALCSYVAPEPLNRIVWANGVKKLSMEEARAKALENANKNTVLLDDFTSNSNEMSSFIFPLCCPISQQLIQTPVRGNACNHWQCFELSNFVESNAHITGTRWECPVCTKILSLEDLQYCPLTASILKQYSKEASPHRDRIQFFANGTWKLLDEAKKRYNKKRPAEGDNMNGNKKARSYGMTASKLSGSSPEVIELL